MSSWGRSQNNASYSHIREEERESEPLLGSMIGASNQTLVSNGQKASRLPQYIAALSATIGGFVMGTIMAWTSPVNSQLAVTDLDKSLIGGFVSIGAMFGAAFGGTLCKWLGRKMTMVYLALPSCVGWGLLIWGDSNVGMLLAGRIILGCVIGIFTVACPLYTTEISETAIRGTLGTFFQLQVTIGIFFDYVVGSNVSVFHFNIICAVFPLLLALLMAFMPESPQFYLLKKNETAAKKSLQWLRGKNYDVNGEIHMMKTSIEKIEAEKLTFREAFSTTPAKKGLIIGIGIMVFQQLSGINGVIFYSSAIFEKAGASLKPEDSSMIVGGVSVAATYISTLIIDKLGRKPLLFISEAIMAVSAGVLGLYFFLQETKVDVSHIGWLPVTSVSVFIIVFSLGLGPIPWMFISEIFPPAIKQPASSVACLTNWLCAFIVTFGFNPVCEAIHQSFTFWIFAVISALGAVFVMVLIPETKGKSLEEIQRSLGGNTSSGPTYDQEKPSQMG